MPPPLSQKKNLLRGGGVCTQANTYSDHYTFLGICPPTPPLSQHFALNEKRVLMLA